MSKIAVIGDEDLVMSFTAFGALTYAVRSKEAAREALSRAEKEGAQIIVIFERWAQDLVSEIGDIKDAARIAVVVIPDNEGSRGLAQRLLKESSIKAVGAEIT